MSSKIKKVKRKPEKRKVNNTIRLLRFLQSRKSIKLLHNFQILISSFFLIFGMIVMFFSVYGYMIQFHNMDLSYNIALISNDVNQELKERNISIDRLDYRLLEDRYAPDKSAPYTEFYLFSADNMPRLIFLAIIGTMIFSFSLFWNLALHTESMNKWKK